MPPFQLLAGHVALDFVNTLDNRAAPGRQQELICTYADLMRFAEDSGILRRSQSEALLRKPKDARDKARVAAIGLRETLARICYRAVDGKAPGREDLLALHAWNSRAMKHRELQYGGGRLTWKWTDLETDVDAPSLLIGFAAVELLTSPLSDRIRACESENCRWLFLDQSKNGSRRWCDMKVCGNRAKVRRFHERQMQTTQL